MARKKQKQKQTNNQKEVENLNKISQDIDQLKESENITEEELQKIEVEINAIIYQLEKD